MAWRLARSLETLRNEVNALAPNRSKASDGTIGDEAHQGGSSDHNPNSKGVVCAMDLTHDPANGADMHKLSRQIVASRPRALKYVIWNRQIWSVEKASQGWRAYGGSNPHTKHMHVSAGVGSDGHSTGPYDDTSSWRLTGATLPGGIMLPSRGDKGETVKYWQGLLDMAGYSTNADGDYGSKTAASVAKWFKDYSGKTYDGNSITWWIAPRLQRQVFAGSPGPAGKDGKAGRDGKDGRDGTDGKDGELKLPMQVAITGTVTAAE